MPPRPPAPRAKPPRGPDGAVHALAPADGSTVAVVPGGWRGQRADLRPDRSAGRAGAGPLAAQPPGFLHCIVLRAVADRRVRQRPDGLAGAARHPGRRRQLLGAITGGTLAGAALAVSSLQMLYPQVLFVQVPGSAGA